MYVKNGKAFTSKSVGTGPSSYEKRIYRAAVSQGLRNTGLYADCRSEPNKGKGHPVIGHEGPEREQRDNSILNIGAGWGWVVNATSRPLYPRARPGTHCIRGWVDPTAGLNGLGKSRPHEDSIPGPSSQKLFAIPTTTLWSKPNTKVLILINFISLRSVPWFRWLVVDISSRRPWFDSMPGYARFAI